MKKIWGVFVCLAALFGWLALAPIEAEPVAWSAPAAPAMGGGAYAGNSRLAAAERIARGKGVAGADSLAADASGRVVAGLENGDLVRIEDNGAVTKLTNTGGRPLGLAFRGDTIVVADGLKGLLAFEPASGATKVLATQSGGVKFGFPDDVKVSADGRYAYMSDASIRWPLGRDTQAILEHRGDGRLIRYDFETGKTETLMEGLDFANGVALGPDEAYVALTETANYRVLRYWLKGEKAGTRDVFAANLPGFPDNITFNGKDLFWVAIYAPRNPAIDWLADKPFLRKAMLRALEYLPKPVEKTAMVLALDLEGRPLALAQDAGKDNFSPVTHAMEVGDWLYLGSFTGDGIARIRLPAALGR